MRNKVEAEDGCAETSAGFPDVYSPDYQPRRKDWAGAQRRRRSEILAKTRWLIAEHKLSDVSIRLIAAESGYAVQTLYNLIGNRTEILQAALEENITLFGRYARRLDQYPNPIIALSETNYHFAVRYPGLLRQTALAYSPIGGSLHMHLEHCLMRVFASFLSEMGQDGALCDTVDIPALSAALTSINVITTLEWAGGFCDADTMRREQATRNGFMLLSALSPGAAARVSDWLDVARTAGPGAGRPAAS